VIGGIEWVRVWQFLLVHQITETGGCIEPERERRRERSRCGKRERERERNPVRVREGGSEETSA